MNLYQVLISPVVTEKSVSFQEKNTHVFFVHSKATKVDVEKAIETYYGITPLSIRMLTVPKKTRTAQRGRVVTKRRALKKAIVRLPLGKSLELVTTTTKKSSSKTSHST